MHSTNKKPNDPGIFSLLCLLGLLCTLATLAQPAQAQSFNPTQLPAYRTVTRSYHTDSYYRKGLLERETLSDAQGRAYTETINRYTLLNVPAGAARPTALIFNVALGSASLAYNLHEGNYGWAALDAAGLAYDGVATAIPFLPAGASAGLKAYRAGNTLKESLTIGNDVATVAKHADKAVKATADVGSAASVGTKIHKATAEALGEVAGKAEKLSESASSFFKGANKSTGKQPDLSWEGSGIWADLTTKGSWGEHVSNYGKKFGDGIGLLYERGKGLVDQFRLRSGGGAATAGAQGVKAANE